MKTNLIHSLLSGQTAVETELGLSQESLEQLPGATECEYVFFYKLTNPSQLFKAEEIIEQEQFQIQLPQLEGSKYKGWLRSRKEKLKADAEPSYTTTLKVSEDGVSGRKELNLAGDAAFHECFALVAPDVMRKTRFIVPIEGTEGKGPDGGLLKWEIDVFDDPEAEGAEHWVKVDLEVKEPLNELPEFPFSYEKSITNQWNQRTEEEQEFIKQLFAKVYTKPVPPAETETEPDVGATSDSVTETTEGSETADDQAETQAA